MTGPLSFQTFARVALAVGAALSLGACSLLPSVTPGDSLFGLIQPYRMEVVQGNVVTKEAAALAKPGLSRQQVRDLLGSPMLTDLFHADRWDYVFTIRRRGAEAQRRSVVAWFKDDKLERLEANDLPSEREFVASIFRVNASAAAPVLALTPEQVQALPRPAKVEAAAGGPAATGAVRSYPPLEPL